MIDFHNHILPNVDDGSDSVETSLSMLRSAAKQGITDVVNTVHYQHPKVDGLEINYETIERKTKELQINLNNHNIPIKLHIGAEVFYLPNLLELKNDPLATFGNGKYMLIEFQPHNIPNSHKKIFFDLKMQNVTPIIAHPERYRAVQNDFDLVSHWLDAGCLIQVDAGSVLGLFGKSAYNAANMIIKKGYCQILGSDAHDNKKRGFVLLDAYQKVKNWIGKNADCLVKNNPEKILNGEQYVFHEIDDNNNNKIKPSYWNKFLFKKNI